MEITEPGLLAIKAEVTYGTDPVPTAAANLFQGIDRDSVTIEFNATEITRRFLDGTLEEVDGWNALPNVKMTFRYELRGITGLGAGGAVRPEIDHLLQAANLVATATAESVALAGDGNVEYNLGNLITVGPSVTCYFWTQKKLHKLTGGKVNVKWILEPDKIAYLEFTVYGKYSIPTDVDITTPMGTAVFTAGFGPCIVTSVTNPGPTGIYDYFELDLGNQIQLRPDMLSTAGVKGFVITGRKTAGKLTVESDTLATYDWFTMWRSNNGVVNGPTLGFHFGQAADNNFTLTCNATIKTPNYEIKNGLRYHNIQFKAVNALAAGTGTDRFRFICF